MKFIVLLFGDAGAIISGNLGDFYEDLALEFYYSYVFIVSGGFWADFLGERIFYWEIIIGFRSISWSGIAC